MSSKLQFEQLARMRQEMNCPPAATPEGEKCVLAKLEIGGREFYGMNARAAGMPKELRRFMREVAPLLVGKGFAIGISGHLAHAEADVLIQAYNSGVTRDHKTGVMFVDKATCSGFCHKKGGIDRLLAVIGMDSVQIHDPAHTQPFTIPACFT